MDLTLSSQEARELRDVLTGVLAELRSEIHHTDMPAYRRGLQDRERMLRHIREQLGAEELVG